MEIETMSKVGGSFESSDTVAAKNLGMDTADVKAVVKNPDTTTAKSGSNSTDDKKDQEKGNKHQLSEATINDAVSSANRKLERTRCEYSYHQETNRVSIKVFDADTDEVIREIPPEKSLDMLQKMWELAGLIVDEKR